MSKRDMRHLVEVMKHHDPSATARAFGMHYATVTNVNDPDGMLRIKVRTDDMQKDEETHWIPPKAGFMGDGFGSTFHVPCVDDRVQIEFISGNMMNPVWVGVQYTPGERAELASAPRVAPPAGHDARRDERVNVLRTMSGWVLTMIEGLTRGLEWTASLVSPTGQDWIKWYNQGHQDTGRAGGVVEAQFEELLTVKDGSATPASFVWDAEGQHIGLTIHPSGTLQISSPSGAVVRIEPSGAISLSTATALNVTAPVVTVESGMVTLGDPLAALPMAKFQGGIVVPCINVKGS